MYKVIDNTKTSECESFMHHHAIMASKVYHYDAIEATIKGKVSYISFKSNQEQKAKSKLPTLVKNKYAETLVPVTVSSKLYGDRKYIQEFLFELFGDISETIKLNCENRIQLMDKSLQKRIASNKKAWALFEQNTALKNLYNSTAHEGNTNTFDHTGHPRPCPPYPFQWKDYTNDEKVKEGFVEVAKKTLSIKIRFKKEDEHIDDVCNICDERDTASMITCMKCSKHSC